MAIDFVDITDNTDGAINKIAAQMAEVRKMAGSFESTIAAADQFLGEMDTELPLGLPSLNDIDSKLADIDNSVRDVTADIVDVAGIGGSCLAPAVNALISMKKDAYGIVEEGMLGLQTLVGLPQDMINLYGIFNQAKVLLGNLGIQELIASIYDGLGCLADSSLLDDVTNELSGIQNQLGLDSTGQIDSTAYSMVMNDKLSTVPGLDPEYQAYLNDGMNRIADASHSISETTKETMKTSVTNIQNSAPKVTVPSDLF